MWYRWITLFFFFAQSVSAQDEALTSVELWTSPLPLFSVKNDNGQVSGYSIEFAQGVFRIAQYKHQITPLPFARLIQDIGEAEMPTVATGIARTPEREDDFFWIAPMTANAIGVYTLKSSVNGKGKPKSFSELESVGVLRGDYRADIVKHQNVRNIVEYSTWDQAINAVLKGRIQAVFFSELGITVTCHVEAIDCSDIESAFTHDVQFTYMAMPKREENRGYAIELANAADRFIESKIFARMLDKWLPQFQSMGANVSMEYGAIALGGIDNHQFEGKQMWVLTHLEPPFSEVDERGQLTGYAVELVKGILTEAGMRQKILTAPWQRIWAETESKQDVLVFSLARTKEREDLFHWISPITQNAYSVFGKASHPKAKVSSLSELPSDSTVAVLKGDFREKIVKDAGLRVVSTSDWTTALELFLGDQVDYFFFSDGGMDIFCRSSKLSCDDVVRTYEYELATTYLAVSKAGTAERTVEKLKGAAIDYKSSQHFNALANRWLVEFEQRELPNMRNEEGVIRLWTNLINE